MKKEIKELQKALRNCAKENKKLKDKIEELENIRELINQRK